MGKKRVAESTSEDSLKESEKQQATLSAQKTKGKKKSRVLEKANIYIRSSYNNVKITVTDSEGNVVGWATSGAAGFKGPRKATPYAASRIVENTCIIPVDVYSNSFAIRSPLFLCL